MKSTISVISRVRKTAKTAWFTRALHSNMYVLKIANATRNQKIHRQSDNPRIQPPTTGAMA